MASQEQSDGLQSKLKAAEMTEELKKRAERRASELESAVAATRERARELIHSLEKQRQAWAEPSRGSSGGSCPLEGGLDSGPNATFHVALPLWPASHGGIHPSIQLSGGRPRSRAGSCSTDSPRPSRSCRRSMSCGSAASMQRCGSQLTGSSSAVHSRLSGSSSGSNHRWEAYPSASSIVADLHRFPLPHTLLLVHP